MQMSISYSICSEVQAERNIRSIEEGYRRNTEKTLRAKRSRIIEAEACVDHIHMLVSIPPHISISQFMGFLKGKSSLMIFDRHENLKYKDGSRNIWCRRYYVDTVGRNKKVTAEYIRNQLEEDYALGQISMKEYMDPFTGNKSKQAKKDSRT